MRPFSLAHLSLIETPPGRLVDIASMRQAEVIVRQAELIGV